MLRTDSDKYVSLAWADRVLEDDLDPREARQVARSVLRARLRLERNADLARAWEVSVPTIKRWRREEGIPSPPSNAPRPTDPRLGTITDRELACLCGCSKAAVAGVRARAGVAAWDGPRALRPGNHDWDADGRLGTMSDRELGRLVGRSGVSVSKARRRRGIPTFDPKAHPRPREVDQTAGGASGEPEQTPADTMVARVAGNAENGRDRFSVIESARGVEQSGSSLGS